MNNPLRYIDPTGNYSWENQSWNLWDNYSWNNQSWNPWNKYSWSSFSWNYNSWSSLGRYAYGTLGSALNTFSSGLSSGLRGIGSLSYSDISAFSFGFLRSMKIPSTQAFKTISQYESMSWQPSVFLDSSNAIQGFGRVLTFSQPYRYLKAVGLGLTIGFGLYEASEPFLNDSLTVGQQFVVSGANFARNVASFFIGAAVASFSGGTLGLGLLGQALIGIPASYITSAILNWLENSFLNLIGIPYESG